MVVVVEVVVVVVEVVVAVVEVVVVVPRQFGTQQPGFPPTTHRFSVLPRPYHLTLCAW